MAGFCSKRPASGFAQLFLSTANSCSPLPSKNGLTSTCGAIGRGHGAFNWAVASGLQGGDICGRLPMLPEALEVMAAKKGDIPAPAQGTQWESVILADARGHSVKPDEIYDLIEQTFPSLAKIELNARRRREGWDAWRNEVAPARGELLDPSAIEKRIADLFVATRDRGLSVADIADHAFGLAGRTATRAQRLSAGRAAQRVLLRVREAKEQSRQLFQEAHNEVKAALGRERRTEPYGDEYQAVLQATPAYQRAKKLRSLVDKLGGSWPRFIRVGRDRARRGRVLARDTGQGWPPIFSPAGCSRQTLGGLDPARWRHLGRSRSRPDHGTLRGDRLLAALGTSAPEPQAPAYAPKGMPVVYRRVRSGGQRRIGANRAAITGPSNP
jgi:MT-A70